MLNITPSTGDKPPKSNLWLKILVVTTVLTSSYVTVSTQECINQFIYLTAFITQTWYKTEKSEKSEDSEVSDPLEKLEQSLEQSDEEKSDESDNSEEQSDEENADDDDDESKPAPIK